MMSSRNDQKLNNKGFTLIELLVSIAIMVIVAGAIGIMLSGSLSNYDYNQTTVGLQIESQQYTQRIGNAIQTTGYAVYTCPATDSSGRANPDVDDLYLYTLDGGSGASQNVVCEIYKAVETSATYTEGGATKHYYTINHETKQVVRSKFDSGAASASEWTGTGESEPLAGGIASIHYTVYDINGKMYTSGSFTGSGSAGSTVYAPKKVKVDVHFKSKNRKLTFEDASFFFRNSTVKGTTQHP